jgi:hypothetical protein
LPIHSFLRTIGVPGPHETSEIINDCIPIVDEPLPWPCGSGLQSTILAGVLTWDGLTGFIETELLPGAGQFD